MYAGFIAFLILYPLSANLALSRQELAVPFVLALVVWFGDCVTHWLAALLAVIFRRVKKLLIKGATDEYSNV